MLAYNAFGEIVYLTARFLAVAATGPYRSRVLLKLASC